MKSKKQEEFPKKFVGIVSAKSGETKVKFVSLDVVKDDKGKEKTKLFPNGSNEMVVALKDLPKEAQRVVKPKTDNVRFRIRLNEDGDAVEAVTPVNGMFSMKLTDLGKRENKDSDPAPYEKWYNKGKENENSYMEFFAVYEITQGVFRGVQLPVYYLHYKFEAIPEGEDEEGNTQFDTVDSPKASQLHKLQNWAQAHGDILEEPIRWPEDGNILPTLLERALDADVEVQGVIEKGYIQTVQRPENYEDVTDEVDPDSEEEFEKAFPVKEEEKKTTSKTKRVVKKSSASDDDDL